METEGFFFQKQDEWGCRAANNVRNKTIVKTAQGHTYKRVVLSKINNIPLIILSNIEGINHLQEENVMCFCLKKDSNLQLPIKLVTE